MKILKLGILVLVINVISSCSIGKTVSYEDYPVTLSETEKSHPLAKYYNNLTKPSSEHLESLVYYSPDKGLAFSDISKMLESGDLDMENGYTKFKDGSGYIAVKTQFPNATGEMIDWWFEWVGYDVIRYKIWYPGLHSSALYENYEEPESFSISKYVLEHPEGKTKHTIETVMKDGPLSDLQITFVNPEQFGLDNSKLGKEQWALCANVKTGNKTVVHMVHFFRNSNNGVEMRSRFWVGRDFSWVTRKIGVKKHSLYELAHHCISEYTQLASFLPEVYRTYANIKE